MKTRIHINQHNIRANRKTLQGDALAMATVDADPGPYPLDQLLPVITAKDYKQNRKGFEAVLVDDDGVELAKVIYSPDKPLSCGATVWIETDCTVNVR